MPRPKKITDRQLLAAARRVFLRKGIHAPVSDVAKELGVSVGTLFFRMKTKNRLLAGALFPPMAPEVHLLEQGPQGSGNSRQRLTSLLAALCNSFLPEAVPSLFLLYTAGALPLREEMSETTDVVLRRALEAWFRKAVARGDKCVHSPYAAADAIMGSMEARFFHGYLQKKTFTKAQNRLYIKRVLNEVLRERK